MAKNRTYTGERFRWKRENQLGQGGQGSTWHATKLDDDSTGWVLKDLHGDRLKPRARLKREVETLDRLQCKGVPTLQDYSLEPTPFIVTANVGTDMEKEYAASGFPPLKEALGIFESLVHAAKCAHDDGVLHRDIKPANVVVDDTKVWLIDFGLCADIDDGTALTTTDEGFGTQAFTAPECSPGSYDQATESSDIYSLGKLFFWLVSGGRLINREEFDERHIAQIDHENFWVRNAAAHLVSGTVLEAAAKRWSAQQLLDWVDWLRAKIEQHENAAEQGRVIVWDGLGPAWEVNRSGTKSVSFRSPSYYDHKIAVGFEMPGEIGPARLEEIALGVRWQGGTGRLRVSLAVDSEDDSADSDRRIPDLDNPVEIVDCVATSRDCEILHLAFPAKPVLDPGHRYWVCLSAPDPGTTVAWFSPQVAYPRVPSCVARHADEYPEGRAGRVKAPAYALQVTASPT